MKEFEDNEHCIAGSITVAPQEDADNAGTGLVILRPRNASMSIYSSRAATTTRLRS